MSDFWHKLGCCVVEKPQPGVDGASFRAVYADTENIVVAAQEEGETCRYELEQQRADVEGRVKKVAKKRNKNKKKRRRRIDRSMIGEPMNFVHLTHIGSGDMGATDGHHMAGSVQEQMRSKGGRDRQRNGSRVL
ncbi:CDC42 small effector protein 1 [Ambystoma mexicanum]|uniref:CDC42 small effector protein 1 n=1 Tax=Ambystoma mexicanum TaxID=8296 RepID=UPI0037E85595